MYEAKIKRRTVRLTNEQYRAMRQRWNLRNFKKKDRTHGESSQDCILCELRISDRDCGRCPLASFTDEGYGCLFLLYHFLKTDNLPFRLGTGWITYHDKNGKESIKRVYDLLKTKFKKV